MTKSPKNKTRKKAADNTTADTPGSSDATVKPLPGWSLSKVRLALFATWAVTFMLYLMFFWVCTFDQGILPTEANDSMKRVASFFVPVLAAFIGFWMNDTKLLEQDAERIANSKALVILISTVILHLFFLAYTVSRVWNVNFPEDGEPTFTTVVNDTLFSLATISSVLLVPVTAILKRHLPIGTS